MGYGGLCEDTKYSTLRLTSVAVFISLKMEDIPSSYQQYFQPSKNQIFQDNHFSFRQSIFHHFPSFPYTMIIKKNDNCCACFDRQEFSDEIR